MVYTAEPRRQVELVNLSTCSICREAVFRQQISWCDKSCDRRFLLILSAHGPKGMYCFPLCLTTGKRLCHFPLDLRLRSMTKAVPTSRTCIHPVLEALRASSVPYMPLSSPHTDDTQMLPGLCSIRFLCCNHSVATLIPINECNTLSKTDLISQKSF